MDSIFSDVMTFKPFFFFALFVFLERGRENNLKAAKEVRKTLYDRIS